VISPQNIQIVGNEVAIAWSDGAESYFTFAQLRAASPSAEMQADMDMLSRRAGLDPRRYQMQWVNLDAYPDVSTRP